MTTNLFSFFVIPNCCLGLSVVEIKRIVIVKVTLPYKNTTETFLKLSLTKGWSNVVRNAGNVIRSQTEHSGSVSTMLEKLENAALFLRLGLPSTLIRHENAAFQKRSSNRRNLKTPAFRSHVDGSHFENGVFRKRCSHDYVGQVLLKGKFKTTGECYVFKFFGLIEDGASF